MLSVTPADPINVPPSPLTFETSSTHPQAARARPCFEPESSNTSDRNPELADWMETNLPRRLYGLSFCTFYLAAHSHQQRAGEPKPSDSPAHPGRRYLSKHRVRFATHHRRRRGDSRRLADREAVPQSGRFQPTGESCFRSLSVKLQKNSCVTPESVGGVTSVVPPVLLVTVCLESSAASFPAASWIGFAPGV